MSKQLGNKWKGATVSEATMREQDLVPKFVDVVRELGTKTAIWKELVREAPPEILNKEHTDFAYPDDDDPIWASDDLSYWFNEVLWTIMDDIAPEGCSFGAHDGDGACYGFWTDEDAEARDEQLDEDEARNAGLDEMTVLDAVKYLIEIQTADEYTHWLESGMPKKHTYIALQKLQREF